MEDECKCISLVKGNEKVTFDEGTCKGKCDCAGE